MKGRIIDLGEGGEGRAKLLTVWPIGFFSAGIEPVVRIENSLLRNQLQALSQFSINVQRAAL